MKMICKCGVVVERDLRKLCNKAFVTKKGYKSYCDKLNKTVYLKTK